MKEDASSFEVRQTTKLNMTSTEKSDFHSKMQRIGETTRFLVLCLKKMALLGIHICLILICTCWLWLYLSQLRSLVDHLAGVKNVTDRLDSVTGNTE